MAKHYARVTQEPGVVREIDDTELLALARQGLLHSYEHTAEAKTALGGRHVETPAKWKAADAPSDIVSPDAPITDPAEAKG